MSNVTKVSVMIGDTELVFETGKIAKQANGAVYAHYAGSAVIATVCCGEQPSEPIDYVPVSVEYLNVVVWFVSYTFPNSKLSALVSNLIL